MPLRFPTASHSRHSTRPNRLSRLGFESLERRNLLAAAIWDGGGGDSKWSTPANWVGDLVPAQNDDVTINDSRTIEVLYDLDSQLTLASLDTSESIKLISGGVTVTDTTLFAANTQLTVQQGAEFEALGATTVDTVNLVATSGGKLSLPGVTSYTNKNTNDNDRYLRADGAGSKLSLPNVTSIASSVDRADELIIQARYGGTVEIGTDVSETVVPSGAVQFDADGGTEALASLIDLPNLTSFTGYMNASTAGFFP
ncbi:hypothetical protein C2E31_23270, partial [Rhodopirellula baltica]